MIKPKIFTALTLAVFSLNIISCDNRAKKEDQQKIDPPEGVIDAKRAMILQETYTKTRYDTLTKYLGKEDNRSNWIAIDELENYITYAKQEAAIEGNEVTGMRIYFGAYPVSENQEGKSGLSTVFIVPTGKSSRQQGNVLLGFQEGDRDLDVPPLNHSSCGRPPSSTYPQ